LIQVNNLYFQGKPFFTNEASGDVYFTPSVIGGVIQVTSQSEAPRQQVPINSQQQVSYQQAAPTSPSAPIAYGDPNSGQQYQNYGAPPPGAYPNQLQSGNPNYGAPPPQGSYEAPPPGAYPNQGSNPNYGAPPTQGSYEAPPPGAYPNQGSNPNYGASQPNYGAPQPNYGTPQPNYGAPQSPNYGAPPPNYGGPLPAGGGPPSPTYASAPPPSYGAPPPVAVAAAAAAYEEEEPPMAVVVSSGTATYEEEEHPSSPSHGSAEVRPFNLCHPSLFLPPSLWTTLYVCSTQFLKELSQEPLSRCMLPTVTMSLSPFQMVPFLEQSSPTTTRNLRGDLGSGSSGELNHVLQEPELIISSLSHHLSSPELVVNSKGSTSSLGDAPQHDTNVLLETAAAPPDGHCSETVNIPNILTDS
jgi:hypothetical protein